MKYLTLLLLAFLLCACGGATDEELLAKDQKALESSLDSYKVNSYRFAKIGLRASIAEEGIVPPEVTEGLQRVSRAIGSYSGRQEELGLADYLKLYRDYKAMESFVQETDEDIFPTLQEAVRVMNLDSGETAAPLMKGDEKLVAQNAEHAVLSALSIVSQSLGEEIALYECYKTKPELLPADESRALIQFFRGFLFLEKKLLYLSQEEFSSNIAWLDEQQIDLNLTKKVLGQGRLNNEQAQVSFHGMNHLLRGIDRLMMERDIDHERALEDFEAFLEDAHALGLENELVWSVEVYLYIHKGEQEKTIASLRKLRTSPLLTKREIKSIDESIAYLESRDAGEALTGVYDKTFLAKTAFTYIRALLREVDWKKIMKENGVPYTDELFGTFEQASKVVSNIRKNATGDAIKEEGKEIWDKTKGLLD
ncbi:MAG: short-chain dehydrogenase [Bacteroidia bacterium]